MQTIQHTQVPIDFERTPRITRDAANAIAMTYHWREMRLTLIETDGTDYTATFASIARTLRAAGIAVPRDNAGRIDLVWDALNYLAR